MPWYFPSCTFVSSVVDEFRGTAEFHAGIFEWIGVERIMMSREDATCV